MDFKEQGLYFKMLNIFFWEKKCCDAT